MTQIKVTGTEIEGLYLIEPTVHGDRRGFFMETYNQREMIEAGLDLKFVQDNLARSEKGVLRGLHYQIRYPQGKLISVLEGEVFDVAVDIRPGSPTYGKWHGEILSAENHRMMYISRGFAHGYLVLSDQALFAYKVTDFWHPDDEGGIAWNDPVLNICWPQVTAALDGTCTLTDGTPLQLSEKDTRWGGFKPQT